MRAGVAGLGSMGRRRVRDMLALGHQVFGYDVRPDRSAAAEREFGISTASSSDELLGGGAEGAIDALIISTPPDCHVEYYERALRAGLPFFSEASILTPTSEWFEARAAGPLMLGCPSATMRFDPLVMLLRERIAALGPDGMRSFHYAAGDYLPRWHPFEEYDEFYAGAGRATSGARESVTFELDWICWMLGPVATVNAIHRACGEWRTDIDDTYALLLEFESGIVGTLTLELHQLAPFKLTRLSHREQSLTLDLYGGTLIGHRLASDGGVTSEAIGPTGVDRQQVYLEEIRAFADAVAAGRPYFKSWQEDRHLSDVLCAAELSEQSGAWVRVEDVHDAYAGTDLSRVPPIYSTS
ncbi:MAG TPA: Gfo/Idh/MocA family oxidoreductase [Solirubrobacteraceae bacterium]|nr:Gfo/Idh/MocA family oxidoreductase [Solirubrobacteraceae bacterium]